MSNDQSAEQQRPEEERAEEWREVDAAEAPGQASDTEDPGVGESAGETDPEQAPGADSQAESGEATAEAPEAEIARLTEELESARAQANDYWQRLVRSEAEKENVRKRAEKDVENARRQGLEKLANELLGVRDSLELGLDAARQEDADLAKIREGTELTLKMLTQAMEKFNIEEIDPVGEKFDPDLHQAMSMQEAEDQESNTVISVVQKGYRLNDRLLRPALVLVAK